MFPCYPTPTVIMNTIEETQKNHGHHTHTFVKGKSLIVSKI